MTMPFKGDLGKAASSQVHADVHHPAGPQPPQVIRRNARAEVAA